MAGYDAQTAYTKNVRPLTYAEDGITTKTYHGTTIAVNNRIIGRITSWQPTAYSREGNHIYELNAATWGRPVDYVPGKSSGFTIALTRVEVWKNELELALGIANAQFEDLMDQTAPFNANEILCKGAITYQIWTYYGCWFQERNEDAQTADGDGVFRCNATMAYISRQLTYSI